MGDSFSINDNIKVVAAADLYEAKCSYTKAQMARRHPDNVDIADDKMHHGLDAYKRVLDVCVSFDLQ